MKTLIKLAAASLIGMSGLTAGATNIAHNMADADKKKHTTLPQINTQKRVRMKKLIKLAAASLIGMSGLTVGATNIVKNMAEAADK